MPLPAVKNSYIDHGTTFIKRNELWRQDDTCGCHNHKAEWRTNASVNYSVIGLSFVSGTNFSLLFIRLSGSNLSYIRMTIQAIFPFLKMHWKILCKISAIMSRPHYVNTLRPSICVSNLTTIDSEYGLSPGRYQSIIWNIVNWTLGTKLRWNHNRNLYTFIQETAFKYVVWHIHCHFVSPC